MDDGTEDDYDSHIMVWQVADQGAPPALSNSLSSITSASSLLLSPTEPIRNPSTHSSIELGPTPGSGMALDSQSEDAHFFGSDTDSETPAPSLHLPETSSPPLPQPYHPPVEPLAWSDDVESMLNNPPPSTFHSFNLSREPSLSSWVLPPDSESQQSMISEHPSLVPPTTSGLERIPESESSLDTHQATPPVISLPSSPTPDSPNDSLSSPSPKPGLHEPVEDFAGHPSRLC